MKKAVTILLAFLLLSLAIKSVQADVYVKVKVNDDNSVNLSFKITEINSTVYEQAKNILNETTIIKAINASTGIFIEKYDGNIQFIDETHSVSISYSFFNYIVHEEYDKEKNLRIFKVTTIWRHFKLSLTESYSIDFSKIFALSVSKWNKTGNTYIYNTKNNFGNATFEITGPELAVNSYVSGEVIIFEALPSKIDVFINSPYIVLLIVVAIVLVALVYRKLRYGRAF